MIVGNDLDNLLGSYKFKLLIQYLEHPVACLDLIRSINRRQKYCATWRVHMEVNQILPFLSLQPSDIKEQPVVAHSSLLGPIKSSVYFFSFFNKGSLS